MILSLFVSGLETTIMTIETTNAIAMQLGMMVNGEGEPPRETVLMTRSEAFARTGPDKLADVANAIILGNFRTAIRANEICLRSLQIDSSTPVA